MQETRELHDHKTNVCNTNLKILVLDQPGQGGANHVYAILAPQDIEANNAPDSTDPSGTTPNAVIANRGIVRFQNGPIKEHGVNGVTQEALLTIVIDRLRSFQAGPFSCRENAIALTHVETGLKWLQSRTIERQRRGVEGTNQK